ncbi:MAG TPA: peroxiredoxin-like family protein [Acidobacteriota bacterium]|nr:peroxiredoxin-like family protein [Acidobacteriota bacterium]
MAQLRRFEEQFQEHDVQIVLIAFGSPHWARIFVDEVGVDYPMLLDPEKEVYRAYGFERSMLRAYSPQVIWYYLKAIAARRPVRLSTEGDTLQLGGNVLVGRDGRILLHHYSRQPTDRPSPDSILARLREPAFRSRAG